MSKLWVQSLALTSAIAGFGLPSSSILIEGAMIAQNRDSSMQISQAVQHPVLELWKPPEDSKPVRNPFCPIFPSLDYGIVKRIWNVRPTFIWQGENTIDIIKITLKSSDDNSEVWSYNITENHVVNPGSEQPIRIIAYPSDKEALQPGKYSLVYETENDYTDPIEFEVVASEEYEITNSNLSGEKLALQRAESFAKKGLWADVLQEFVSIHNPSSDWVVAVSQIGKRICDPPKEDG